MKLILQLHYAYFNKLKSSFCFARKKLQNAKYWLQSSGKIERSTTLKLRVVIPSRFLSLARRVYLTWNAPFLESSSDEFSAELPRFQVLNCPFLSIWTREYHSSKFSPCEVLFIKSLPPPTHQLNCLSYIYFCFLLVGFKLSPTGSSFGRLLGKAT